MTKTKNKELLLRMPPTIFDALERAAERHGYTFNELIRECIRKNPLVSEFLVPGEVKSDTRVS